ncbi:nicotinamide-nucleotide amidohydrolase family protein, partial [Candidatus Bipolaricaulota bacterium]|nr:nicotinamide-nucleotide amidohydrolase family protein [Candidatus Bipolaricaulota bacterium]
MCKDASTPDDREVKVANLLKNKDLSISVAESCTGGLVSHKITNVPGSSEYFNRAVVAYSNQAKRELLAVKAESLQSHGAVSEVVASEMAKGIRVSSGTDIGLSTTGIA